MKHSMCPYSVPSAIICAQAPGPLLRTRAEQSGWRTADCSLALGQVKGSEECTQLCGRSWRLHLWETETGVGVVWGVQARLVHRASEGGLLSPLSVPWSAS